MPSIYDKGGMIGSDLYFYSTDRHIVGTTTGPGTPTYVGGQTVSILGGTTAVTTTFNLTGGLAATPAANDIVIAIVGIAGITNVTTTAFPLTGYTAVTTAQYGNGTNDINSLFCYKLMGSTPDTNFTLPAGTRDLAYGGAIALHVWRYVSTTLTGGIKVSTNTSSGIPNPAATIVSANNLIIACGATAHTGGVDTFTSSNLGNFRTVGVNDTYDCTVGIGSFISTGASFDPAAFGFTQTDSAAFTTTAYTVGFAPATVTFPIYGNLKNSGIWSMKSLLNSDQYFSNVSLLLGGNGSDGGTVFTDSSTNNLTVTPSGNAVTSTTIKKYGTASMFFDGTGDYLSIPYTTALDLVASSFTIEAWVYPTSFKASGIRVFSTGGGNVGWNATTGIHVLVQLTSTGRLDFQIASGLGSPIAALSTATVSLNTWSHIAVSFLSPTSVKLFINGVAESFTITAPTRPSTNPTTAIATIPGEAGGASIAYQGYIDDLRVTKGVARYTQTFTPPIEFLR